MWRLIFIILLISGCQATHNLQPDLDSNITYHSYGNYNLILQASHEEAQGDIENSLKLYNEAAKFNPSSNFLAQKISSLLLTNNDIELALIHLQQFILNNQASIKTKHILASIYIATQQTDLARNIYTEIIDTSTDLDTLIKRSALYFYLDEKKLSYSDINKALKIDPNFSPALLAKARLFQKEKKLSQSIRYYKRYLAHDWALMVAYELGDLYLKTGEYSKALATYNTILKYSPSEDFAFAYKIICLIQTSKVAQARSALDEKRSFIHNPELLDSTVAEYLIAFKLNEEAKVLLGKMIILYKSNRAKLTIALLEYEEGNFAKSIEWIQQINRTTDEYIVGQELEIQILLRTKQETKAINKLTQLISSVPNKPTWFLNLALIYDKQNLKIQVEQTYLKSLQIFESNPDLSFQYALFLDGQKRYKEGIAIMTKVLEQDPDNNLALNYIGYSWADNDVNLHKALEYTKKAEHLEPGNGYIMDSVGWCYYKLGKYDKALDKLLSAKDIIGDDPNILEHIGDTYNAMSDTKNAIYYYQESLKKFDDKSKQEIIRNKIIQIKGKQ
ncbi:MAG: tetratricopeptide repeat protein [Desulfotalea sp.]